MIGNKESDKTPLIQSKSFDPRGAPSGQSSPDPVSAELEQEVVTQLLESGSSAPLPEPSTAIPPPSNTVEPKSVAPKRELPKPAGGKKLPEPNKSDIARDKSPAKPLSKKAGAGIKKPVTVKCNIPQPKK